MKNLRTFEQLTYSGGDVETMKIIGHITTCPIKWSGGEVPSQIHSVVEIVDDPTGKYYVLNRWYKGHVPNIVHENMVEHYKPV